MNKKDQSIIRVGDEIRIITPELFVRCGYPMDFEAAKKEMEEKFSEQAMDFILQTLASEQTPFAPYHEHLRLHKAVTKVLSGLAYAKLHLDGFGGNDRKIYTVPKPELLGQVLYVYEVTFKQTGTYYPPSGGYLSYSGDYDYEPGGLTNVKTHKILGCEPYLCTKELMYEHARTGLGYYTEAKNVEKICGAETSRTSTL